MGNILTPAVTLVVTSCGRPDLLERTVASFQRFNTCPIAEAIIVEDGPGGPPPIPCRYITSPRRRGQIACIDDAYHWVTTPYIFHCEDDWEFYRPGFIEASREVLAAWPAICQVWLRAHDDTMGHPVVRLPRYPFDVMQHGYFNGRHSGFSFNPGLRRLADYRRLGPYGRHCVSLPGKDWHGEEIIGELYRQAGFHAAILPEGYVRHTGWGRTVN